MSQPSAGAALTPMPRATHGIDNWHDALIEVPHNLGLVRAWNGRCVQKCSYDASEKIWRNQSGEEIKVLKWKYYI